MMILQNEAPALLQDDGAYNEERKEVHPIDNLLGLPTPGLFGTTEGVTAVSPDGHATTAAWPNASEGIAGFAAAEVGDGSIQCFVLTAPPSGLAPDSLIETVMASSLALYSSTLHAPGAVPAWSLVQ